MAEVRVYYDHRPRYVIGPLGVHEIQAVVECKGVPAVVCRLDPDGAAVAWEVAWIEAEAERRGISNMKMIDTLVPLGTVGRLMKESEMARG